MNERFTMRVAVHLIIEKDNKVLFGLRQNTGYANGDYGLPGGHMDGGEDVYNTMIREAKEELNITIKKEDLEIVHVMNAIAGVEYIFYFFIVKNYEGEPSNMESDKCVSLEWIDLDNLPDNVVDYEKELFDKYYKNRIPFSTYKY